MSVLTQDKNTARSTTPNTTGKAVREELDLDRPEGLALFLESAEDVYADAMQHRAVAQAEQYRSLDFSDVRGEEVFATLDALMQAFQGKVLGHQEQVSEKKVHIATDEINRMQRIYDDMIVLRDLIIQVYQGRRPAAQPVTVSSPRPQPQSKPKENEVKPVASVPHQPSASRVPISPAAVTQEAALSSELYTRIEEVLKKTKQQIAVVRARILNQFSAATRTPEVAEGITELDACSNRLENLSDRVTAARSEISSVAVLRETLEKYTSLTGEIVTRAEVIERQLAQNKAVIAQKKAVSQNQGPSTELSAIADLKKTSARTKPPEQLAIPTEADVTLLAKRVLDEPFYTPAERSVTMLLCEAFHRAVAQNKPPVAILEAFKAIRDQVEMVEQQPTEATLRERAGRILKRVTARLAFDDDILRTTRRLEQEFRTIVADPEMSEVRIRKAYADLERFVRSCERTWLTVCGSPVPAAGVVGIPAARRLRETLLVERDRHTELIHDPKKQLLVDRLVRMLSSISPEGLSAETDIPMIVSLMRMIDVPDRQSEIGEIIRRPEESRQEVVEESEVEERPSVKHKVMDIANDDSEQVVAIKVAEKTAKRLAEVETPSSAETPKVMAQAQIVPDDLPRSDRVATVQTEKRDPINEAVVAPRVVHHAAPSAPELQEQSLTERYLTELQYQRFIEEQYSSASAFERMLDATITQLEAKTVDVFERWLHEEYASPFVFLEGMSVEDVLALGADRDLRVILAAQNIKYETFLTWLDLVPEMLAVVGDHPAMTFGELYARWMIESAMQYQQGRRGRAI